MDTSQSIAEIVRKQENSYVNHTTTVSKYVEFNMHETISRIEAYLNSKHISGDVDALDREKPFFNIVTAACNIWYRATDIDRKNIRIKPTKSSDVLGSFLATVHLQDYMRRENFGVFLNEWGRTLASYGSAVTKFIEADGKLHTSVVPWNTLIVDPVDFENNVKIEVLQMTPAQLRKKKGYDPDMVKNLLGAVVARQTLDKQNKDTKNDYIKLYEVHGELPLSLLTGEENDKDTFVQQMHVISFVGKGKEGEFDDFTLIKGKEKKDPYMITHLIKQDGQSLSIGAVQHLFEAQWMVNHTAKAIKDQLDLASKLIFQTSDGNYVGRNALTEIETGDILIHESNQPLTALNNQSHDITALQNFGTQWSNLAKEITSTPDSISGNTMPSGTAYRQVAILNQESHSLFELMTENKALAIEEMLRGHIIPFLKKKMDNADEISATLADYDITKIDSIFIKNEAIRRVNSRIKESVLNGEIPEGIDLNAEQENIQSQLAELGNQRFFIPSDVSDTTWKEVFKDLEWEVEVEITNESSDKEAVLTTLDTLLAKVIAKQGQPFTPQESFIVNKILTATGEVSPMEWPAVAAKPSPMQIEQPQTTPQATP